MSKDHISGLEPQISSSSASGRRILIIDGDDEPQALSGFEPELGGSRRATTIPRLMAMILTATSYDERQPVIDFIREEGHTLAYTRQLAGIIPRNARRRIAGVWNTRYTQRQRLNAIAAVGALGHVEPAIKPLFAALGDSAEIIRRAAITALATLWGMDDLWLLAATNARERHIGARSLATRGDPRTIAPLLVSLRDEEYLVRAEIATALGMLGAQHAIEDLLKLLKDHEGLVRRAAVEALGAIASNLAEDDPRLQDIIKPLKTILHKGTWAERQAAAEAFGQLGAAEHTWQPLAEALRDRDELVRDSAAAALGRLGDVRAFEPLMEMLQAILSRRTALRALGELGDRRAVPVLLDALYKDADMRLVAATALGRIDDEQSIDELISILRDEAQDYQMHEAALTALREMSSERALEAVEQYGGTRR